MIQSKFLPTGQCDHQDNLDPLSTWKIFYHVFNLLYSTKIQEVFRCQKRSCSYVIGQENEKLRLHKGNEEKNSINKNNLLLHHYKYAGNLEIALILKTNKLSYRWGWLAWFSIIPHMLNFRVLNTKKSNVCTPGVSLISSNCSHPHFSFLRSQQGKTGTLCVGFLGPVLDIYFAMRWVLRKYLFLILSKYKREG